MLRKASETGGHAAGFGTTVGGLRPSKPPMGFIDGLKICSQTFFEKCDRHLSGAVVQWAKGGARMKSSRLFQILYHLISQGQATAPELAKRLEVSQRTIYRDIDALCQAGMPIVTEQGKGGGIRLMDGFVLNKALMSPQEQEQLLLAVKSMAAVTREDSEALLKKLNALFLKPQEDWLAVDLSPWGSASQQDRRFETIKAAILEKRILHFRYTGADGASRRCVKPARLCYKASAWYMQGFCLKRGDWRTFKLSRMSALSLTQEHFAPLPPPPPIALQDGSRWPEVRLRFSPQAAFRVYDEFDPESILQDVDGGLIVTTRMPLADGWLYGYLLSFGGAAQVLAPDGVRLALARYARQVYRRYEKDLSALENLPQDVMFGMVSCYHPPRGNDIQQEDICMEQKFCQSCGMPLGDVEGQYGTEKDGAENRDYCAYCYKDGAFTRDCSMEEMIDFCVPFMVQSTPDMTEEKARDMMRQFFPMLKRWAKR